MNNKAFYNLTYGMFLLAAKAEEKANACIVNTGVQVAGSPVRVAVSVLNTNYTCALIKESGRFTLSALDDSCSFETSVCRAVATSISWTACRCRQTKVAYRI